MILHRNKGYVANIRQLRSLTNEFLKTCPKIYQLERQQFIFAISEKVGSGKFGVVYKGVLKSLGESGWQKVAIKKLQAPDEGVTKNSSSFKCFIREIRAFATIGNQNENILAFLGVCCDTSKRNIFCGLLITPNG